MKAGIGDWGLGIGDSGLGIGDSNAGAASAASFAFSPPPAKACGGWERVRTPPTEPTDHPPQPLRPANTPRARSLARPPQLASHATSPPPYPAHSARRRRIATPYPHRHTP